MSCIKAFPIPNPAQLHINPRCRPGTTAPIIIDAIPLRMHHMLNKVALQSRHNTYVAAKFHTAAVDRHRRRISTSGDECSDKVDT